MITKINPALKSPKDPICTYLHSIGRVPLLTAEREIILAQQVQKMMTLLTKKEKLEEKLDRPLGLKEWAELVEQSTEELSRTIQLGQRAKTKIISANLRLVVSIAKKYQNRGLELLDLIQEGNIGLNRAVEKFDPTKGYKFSTYGYWWIRQAITRAIANDSRTIRLPVHVTEKLNKIKKTQQKLSQNLGRTPTVEEIAESSDLGVEEIRKCRSANRRILSLNLKIGDNKETELSELIKDNSASLFDSVEQNLIIQEVCLILEELELLEKEVINLRFGLIDGEELSLAKIGKKLNLSRTRVKQLETLALDKLRQKCFV